MSLMKLLGLSGQTTPNAPNPREAGDTATMQRIAAELEALPEDRARYLAAFAYILGRVAHADAHVSDVETAKMLEIVQALGHLQEPQAALVVEIAKTQVRLFGATDNFLVSRRFKDLATPAQCAELLDCVFAVSAADDSITVQEESQARQISKELGLTHEEFLEARETYTHHLEALKQMRARHRGGH